MMEPLKFEIDGAALIKVKEPDESIEEKDRFEGHDVDYEIGELLKRIEKDIVRCGQIMLDIREELRGERK